MNLQIRITAARLRELLHYDPVSGIFTRRVTCANRKAGELFGSPHGNGYLSGKIDGRGYFLHRLAWLYVYGKWPVNDVDHEDRVRTNNRISNLREASRKQNMENGMAYRSSRSGIRGVLWDQTRQRWRACINHHGKTIDGGRFSRLQDAVKSRASLEARYFTRAPNAA